MLAEWHGLEYVLEVLRVLHHNQGKHDSKKITQLIQEDNRISATVSYVQKILPRMVKIELLISTSEGYYLNRPIDEIMISQILAFSPIPEIDCPLRNFCKKLLDALSLTCINELYDFSKVD